MPTSNNPTLHSSAAAAVTKLFDGLLDLVYPPHCVACERSLHDESGRFFCSDCLAGLPFVPETRCPKCGHELAEHATVHTRCRACEGKSLFFKSASAPFKYETPVRELILQLKLAHQRSFAVPLAGYLADHLESGGLMPSIDAVVAVPLHWRRRLTRGYNQSQLLAERVSEHFGVPNLAKCLLRVRATKSQTSFSMRKRMENLRGAFAVRRRAMLRGKTVLLIDDVLTTGATCAECSRILKQEGSAAAVYVATVARTMF